MGEIERELLEFTREIRDPIYDYIPLTELESIIIDTPAFQRLDRIRQMHAGYKVYPSANYSRKVHSIGAMHLAGKAITRLLYLQDEDFASSFPSLVIAGRNNRKDYNSDVLDELSFLREIPRKYETNGMELDVENLNIRQEEIDGEDDANGTSEDLEVTNTEIIDSATWLIQAVRLMGLLHDVGHGPFSHMLEEIDGVDFEHNSVTPKVIKHLEETVPKTIEEREGVSAQSAEQMLNFVYKILESGEKLDRAIYFLYELTSSPFDVDMLDYLVRDSYFAGTPEYGKIDAERIIRGFVVSDGRLRISRSALTAVNDAFDSYFKMYKAVYTHRTVVMYEILLHKALKEFHSYSSLPFLKEEEDGEEESIDVDEFIKYDDNQLICDMREANKKYKCETDDATNKDSPFWTCFKQFQKREKPYEQLLFYSFNFDMEDRNSKQEKIEETLGDLIDDATGEGINLPYRSINKLKRSGISLDDLKFWLKDNIIYDPHYREPSRALEPGSPLISFPKANPDIGKRLNQIEVNVRIFIHEDELVAHDDIRSAIVDELRNEFKEYERQEEKAMLEEKISKYKTKLRDLEGSNGTHD